MKFIIRDAVKNDIDEIFKIENMCFSLAWSKNSINESIENDNCVFLVATNETESIFGYGSFNFSVDEGYINNIAVDENFRRKKIGITILKALEKEAIFRKLVFLSLEVRLSNIAAIQLYLSIGYEIKGERKDYYNNPTENGLIMTKYL